MPQNSRAEIENRLEAECIIKWVLHSKKTIINALTYDLKKCKNLVTLSLTRCQPIPKSNIVSYVDALCGKSFHTHNSHPFFNVIGYQDESHQNALDIERNQKINQNEKQFENDHTVETKENGEPQQRPKLFPCNSSCFDKKYDPFVVNELENCYILVRDCTAKELPEFLQDLYTCSAENREDKGGHPQECYIELYKCKAKILPLLRLCSHFNELRNMRRLLDEIRCFCNHLIKIDETSRISKEIGYRNKTKNEIVSDKSFKV